MDKIRRLGGIVGLNSHKSQVYTGQRRKTTDHRADMNGKQECERRLRQQQRARDLE